MRAVILVVALGACTVPDKHFVPDGGVGDPDARTDARPIDAPAARYPCMGQPLPTSAPPTIAFIGTTVGVAGEGLLPNASLNLMHGSSFVFVSSSDTNGAYNFSAPTSNVPLDDYIHATFTGRVDTYVYPPSPFAADYHEAIVLATAQEIAQAASAAGTNYNTSNAVLYVTIVDCAGMPVKGATVSTIPAGMVVPLHNGLPDAGATETDESGKVVVFNVSPVGTTITVLATVPEGDFRHTIIHNPTAAVLMTRVQP